MKHFLLLFTFLLTITQVSVFGQAKSKEASLEWSKEQKESRRSTLGEVIGKDKNGIYIIKNEAAMFMSTKFTIEHYDQKMNLKKSEDFELKEGKKTKFYQGSILSKGKLYLFSSFRDKSKKKNKFYVQSVNLKTMRLNNDIEAMAEVDFKGFTKWNAGGFDFDVSRDSSKILVHYSLPYEKKEREKYGFHVFDAELNEVYSKNVTLPVRDELYEVQDFTIDNNGEIHVLGKIFKEKRKDTRKGKPNYSYQILSYYDKGETLEKYAVKEEGKYLNDMQIAIDKNGDIACGGFYSSHASFNVDGTFWLKIDKNSKEVVSKNFKEFDIDFITQNLKASKEKKIKKKDAKGKEYELYSYKLDDIIFDNNGGAVLVGEQYYVTMFTSTDTDGRTRTIYRYNYKDVIVVRISEKGEILWAEKIPKNQVSTNDGGFFSSYQLSIVKDKLYFIFNDNEENLYNKGDGKLKNFTGSKKGIVVLVTMDSKGKQKKEALFNIKEAEVIIRPKVGRQIGYREAIIFGQKRKVQKLAKVTFN